MKVAIVYDRINKWGGAERLILALKKIFKDAPVFTSVYWKDKAIWAKDLDIRASFLQNVPFAVSNHEFFAPLMPIVFESFSFDEFDTVISITSEAAKGIISKPGTLHICICLTPTRYLWSGYNEYFANKLFAFFTKPLIAYLRAWDRIAAGRPDYFVAISKNVEKRIKKYYRRNSTVIYPPTEIEKFKQSDFVRKDTISHPYFLVVSRLVSYKRVDLAIEACSKLSLNLKIIGMGRQYRALKKIAGKTIEFLKEVSDEDLIRYYKKAKALIFPGIEDFGLVMVEAMACGIPVIASRGGGADEIIVEGKTGEFFASGNLKSLIDTLKRFDSNKYNSNDCIKNSLRFSSDKFEENFKNFFYDRTARYFKR